MQRPISAWSRTFVFYKHESWGNDGEEQGNFGRVPNTILVYNIIFIFFQFNYKIKI